MQCLKCLEEFTGDTEALKDDLAKLAGDPPYDVGGNICRGDVYFAVSLEEKYGHPLDELRKFVEVTA